MTKTVRFAGAEDGFWSGSSSAQSSFSSLDGDQSSSSFCHTNYHERILLPPRIPIRRVSYCDLPDGAFNQDEEEGIDLTSSLSTERKSPNTPPPTILRKKSRYSSPPPPSLSSSSGEQRRTSQLCSGATRKRVAPIQQQPPHVLPHTTSKSIVLLTATSSSSSPRSTLPLLPGQLGGLLNGSLSLNGSLLPGER